MTRTARRLIDAAVIILSLYAIFRVLVAGAVAALPGTL